MQTCEVLRMVPRKFKHGQEALLEDLIRGWGRLGIPLLILPENLKLQLQSGQSIPTVNTCTVEVAALSGIDSVAVGAATTNVTDMAPRNVVGAAGTSGVGGGEKFRLKHSDYGLIVDWLENPDNFNLIHGGGKTKIQGRPMSRATIFKQMLVVLQAHNFPRNCSGPNLNKRFARFVAKYKEACELKMSSGGGLIEEDFVVGLTLEDKLERMCPHFERMHALFGSRPNVAPRGTGDFGIDEDEFTSHDPHEDVSNLPDAAPLPHSPTITLTEGPAGVDDGLEFNSPQFWEEDLMDIGTGHVPHDSASNFPGSANSPQTPGNGRNSPNFGPPRDSVSGSFGGMPTHTGTPPITPVGTRATPRQPNVGLANKENQPPKKTPPKKVDNKQPAPPKPNVAQIYAERLLQKADYKKELHQTQEKWKMIELDEKKQARLYSSAESAKRDRLMRKHQLHMENESASNAEKKACLDRYHQWQMGRAERRSQMLIELSRSNKTDEQIKTLMALVED